MVPAASPGKRWVLVAPHPSHSRARYGAACVPPDRRSVARLGGLPPHHGHRRIRQGRAESQRGRKRLQHRLPGRPASPLPLRRRKDLRPQPDRPGDRLPDRRHLPDQRRHQQLLWRSRPRRRQLGDRVRGKHLRRSLEHQHLRLGAGRLAPLDDRCRRRNVWGRRHQHGGNLGRRLRRPIGQEIQLQRGGSRVTLDQHKLLQARDRPHEQRPIRRSL